jgi:hypothetical protein
MHTLLWLAAVVAAYLLGTAIGSARKQKRIGEIICKVLDNRYASIEDVDKRYSLLPDIEAARLNPIEWAERFIRKSF